MPLPTDADLRTAFLTLGRLARSGSYYDGLPSGSAVLSAAEEQSLLDTIRTIFNGPPRTRSEFIPASVLRVRTGVAAISENGTYPARFTFLPLAAATLNAVGVEFQLPRDLEPSLAVTLRALWTIDALGAGAWRAETNIALVTANGSLVAAGSNLTADISTTGLAINNGFVSLLGSAVLAASPGDLVRINVARNGPHANDTFTGVVRLLGLMVEYTPNI